MAIFEETFESPLEKDTQEEAFRVLDEIRKVHSHEEGWEEISSWIEKTPNGKWRAVRRHRKVS